MRERDLDLIAALVEGRLEDETEARALIASSTRHRDEYEAQKLAFETLSAVSSAHMSDHERAALRRDVWTELQVEPTAAQRSTPWYLRWSYAAAGVLIIVGLGAGVVSMMGDEDLALTSPQAGEEADAALAGDGGAATATSEAAGADDGAIDDESGADAAADDDSVERLSESPSALFFFNNADDTREAGTDRDADLAAEHAECIGGIPSLEGFETIGVIEVDEADDVGPDIAGTYLVAAPEGILISDETPIAFVDSETCELAFLDEGS